MKKRNPSDDLEISFEEQTEKSRDSYTGSRKSIFVMGGLAVLVVALLVGVMLLIHPKKDAGEEVTESTTEKEAETRKVDYHDREFLQGLSADNISNVWFYYYDPGADRDTYDPEWNSSFYFELNEYQISQMLQVMGQLSFDDGKYSDFNESQSEYYSFYITLADGETKDLAVKDSLLQCDYLGTYNIVEGYNELEALKDSLVDDGFQPDGAPIIYEEAMLALDYDACNLSVFNTYLLAKEEGFAVLYFYDDEENNEGHIGIAKEGSGVYWVPDDFSAKGLEADIANLDDDDDLEIFLKITESMEYVTYDHYNYTVLDRGDDGKYSDIVIEYDFLIQNFIYALNEDTYEYDFIYSDDGLPEEDRAVAYVTGDGQMYFTENTLDEEDNIIGELYFTVRFKSNRSCYVTDYGYNSY